MTLIHPTTQKTKLRVVLPQNPYQLHLRKFWHYTLGLTLPVISLHVLLSALAVLEVQQHLSVLGVFAVLAFMAVRFLQTQAPGTPTKELLIETDTITLVSEEQYIRLSKKELQLEYLGWGPCVQALMPAVRISHAGRPLITIGARTAEGSWTDIRRSVQATDCLIQENLNWDTFKQHLSQSRPH